MFSRLRHMHDEVCLGEESQSRALIPSVGHPPHRSGGNMHNILPIPCHPSLEAMECETQGNGPTREGSSSNKSNDMVPWLGVRLFRSFSLNFENEYAVGRFDNLSLCNARYRNISCTMKRRMARRWRLTGSTMDTPDLSRCRPDRFAEEQLSPFPLEGPT